VSRASRARRLAVGALYGGGSVGAVTGVALGLLVAEAKVARRLVGAPIGEPPAADGRYGEHPGTPLRLVMMGDSSAAGLGLHDPAETPGALLARGLAATMRRPVEFTSVARSGARSDDLSRQVELALRQRPDAAVIMVGANDVINRVKPSTSVQRLEQAVRQLRLSGCEVIVGTCPDLGTVEPIAQPLRYVARHWSRQLAAAQTIAAVEAGGRTVSLGDILGPEFARRPREFFGPDRFHPSATGYASAAEALLPSLATALGLLEAGEQGLGDGTDTAVLPVSYAAVEAVDEAGTEVAGTRLAGADHGPRGRWAQLRHRPGHPVPIDETAPETATAPSLAD